MIVRASESSHWYDKDGNPCYTVIAKNGEPRPTTLRDAKKSGLVPSVTTIIKLLANPGIDYYKQEQTILACLTLPKHSEESDDDYISRIIVDSKSHAKNAADDGTKIHTSIESFYLKQSYEHEETVLAADKALTEHFGKQVWVPEKTFARDGFAGKTDLSASGIIVDTKTKEMDVGDKPAIYDAYPMQLAAYRAGLGMPDARGANLFVSRNKPGVVVVKEYTSEELDRGWKMFQLLKELFYVKTGLAI
jgi:hypothetical protein